MGEGPSGREKRRLKDENGVITKLKFLGMDDAAGDSLGDDNDPLARLDAEFVLVTGSLRALLKDLNKILG